jgi:glycosyltransferase involved in cell wall biosynthesis
VTPRVTVAICTRNHPDELTRCLTALAPLRRQIDQLLVLDNAPSDDRTREVARAHETDYALEPRPGLGAARNAAIAAATCDVIAFTDDDCEPDPGWIAAILDALSDEGIAAVTGRAIAPGDANPVQRAFDAYARGFCTDTPVTVSRVNTERYLYGGVCGVGANMAFRRAALLEIGGFLDLGAIAAEDDIALIALLRAGHRIRYEPRSLVYQHHRARALESAYRFYEYGQGCMHVIWHFSDRGRDLRVLARNSAAAVAGPILPTLRHLGRGEWLPACFGLAQVAGATAGLGSAFRDALGAT